MYPTPTFIRSAILCMLIVTLQSGCKCGPASNPPSDPRIIGSWKSVGGDYPLTNEYRADGILIQHLIDEKPDPHAYRIEGDELIVSVKQPDGKSFDFKNRFEIRGDNLVFFDDDGTQRTFRRRPKG